MKVNKKNQKGFSLVELVVVILIMGVIAVALAPQVMKWVEEARNNTNTRIKDNLKSVAQAAVAEYESSSGEVEAACYLVTSTGLVTSDGAPDPNDGMIAIMSEVMGGEMPKVVNSSGKVYQMKVEDSGSVSVSVVDGTY